MRKDRPVCIVRLAKLLLMRNIQQSLAGRVGMLKLLPLSYQELSETQISLDTYLIRGDTRVYDAGIPTDMFYQKLPYDLCGVTRAAFSTCVT